MLAYQGGKEKRNLFYIHLHYFFEHLIIFQNQNSGISITLSLPLLVLRFQFCVASVSFSEKQLALFQPHIRLWDAHTRREVVFYFSKYLQITSPFWCDFIVWIWSEFLQSFHNGTLCFFMSQMGSMSNPDLHTAHHWWNHYWRLAAESRRQCDIYHDESVLAYDQKCPLLVA